MKMRAITMALAASAVLAPLLLSEAAQAQRAHSAPRSYNDAPRSYESIRDPRFTEEEQRTIDAISRNDWRSGY
jgi:hypothetical protein